MDARKNSILETNKLITNINSLKEEESYFLDYLRFLSNTGRVKFIYTEADDVPYYTIFRQFLLNEPEIVVDRNKLNPDEFDCLFEQIKHMKVSDMKNRTFNVNKKNIKIVEISQRPVGIRFGIIYNMYMFMASANPPDNIKIPEKVEYVALDLEIN